MSQTAMNPASAASPPVAADPSQGAGPSDPSQGDQGGGFVIILAFQQDGSIQVMPQGGQSGQDDGSGSDQSQPQVVDSLDDAFQAVQQLAQENGYSGSDDSSDPTGADGNAMLSPDDAKSAWDQMAAKRDKKQSMGM